MVDIIVPTYRRYHELPTFFARNKPLEKSNAILWIIDDCSPDFDPTVIPAWENLKYIRLEKNRGQAFARNVAIEKGNNPFVISLDDDAWFEDGQMAIKTLEKLFELYPRAGCVMFNIATPDSSYSHLVTGTELPLHVTCGCAYRRTALNQIGGFPDFLHSQAEETHISLRLYQAGWKIIFANEIKVFHNFQPDERSLSWYLSARHNTTRNDLLSVLMYYPWFLVLPYVFGKFWRHLAYAISNKMSIRLTLLATGKAFVGFMRFIPEALNARKPLTFQQFKNWRVLMTSDRSGN